MIPFLSIIIPAYNEAERLSPTLQDIHRWLVSQNFSYEILVVNDGSKDRTAEKVAELSKSIPNLTLIDNKKNCGKGAVVRQGMLAARGRFRLFMDADNSTALSHFGLMLPFFREEQCDVVIASRTMRGAKLDPPQPFYRQLAGKMLNIVVQVLLLPGIWDTQCGFKAFTARAAEEIFTRARTNGWAFDVEVLALAKNFGFAVKEIPAHWKNDRDSTVPLSAGLRFIAETVTIRFRLWTGKYGVS